MPWFKVDDNLAFHSKVVAAGNSAMGLWVRAGAWAAQQLNDGFVPEHIAALLGTDAQASKLVRAGLWHESEGGYSFHEWDERQPKRERIEEERAAARERMQAFRARKKGTKSAKPVVSGQCSPEVPSTRPDVFGNPDPTRPDHITNTSAEFENWWLHYPKKVSKGDAKRAYLKASKSTDAETLIAGADRYAAQVKGTEQRFIANGATWLNNERWLDEAPSTTRRGGRITHTNRNGSISEEDVWE